MTIEFKESVLEALLKAIDSGMSQNEIARKASISPALVSAVKNRNWDNYSNGAPIPTNVFQGLAEFLRVGKNSVETSQYLQITNALLWAKKEGLAAVIDGHTGSGKTHAIKEFAKQYSQGTYVVTCARDFTQKSFVQELAIVTNADSYGTQYDLRKNITLKLAQDKSPIVILDEAENLTDHNYSAVKALYDALEGRLGIVLVGANEYWAYLTNKARRGGASAGCFPQLVSRFRANVTKLNPITQSDVNVVVTAAGISSKEKAKELFNSSQDYRALFGTLKKQAREAQLNG